jgi:hypothetical protein
MANDSKELKPWQIPATHGYRMGKNGEKVPMTKQELVDSLILPNISHDELVARFRERVKEIKKRASAEAAAERNREQARIQVKHLTKE